MLSYGLVGEDNNIQQADLGKLFENTHSLHLCFSPFTCGVSFFGLRKLRCLFVCVLSHQFPGDSDCYRVLNTFLRQRARRPC